MRNALLRHAIPLVRTHGFTRQALSFAALSLPNHTEPLSEMAVSALFGPGDEARKTLIQAWLEEGINRMGWRNGDDDGGQAKGSVPIREALKDRLKWNEPVLDQLPEAFALLLTPKTIIPLPVLDLLPAISHPARVAIKAKSLANDTSIGTTWYAERTSLALIYTATGEPNLLVLLTTASSFDIDNISAELHQLTSPTTAVQFLDTLLESSDRARDAAADAGQLANFFWRSWAGILKSRGLT